VSTGCDTLRQRESRYDRCVRLLLLLVALTGCDKLFQLRHLDDADASTDGPMRDGRPDSPDAPPDTIQQTHSNCPANFGVPYENSKYHYVSQQLTWYQALMHCQSLDDPTSTKRIHLVVLTGDPERQHVYVNVVGSASRFWIGLSDTAVIDAYQWVTGEQVFYPVGATWASGEPSTDPGDACVLSRYSTTDFDVLPCTTVSEFVCECDDYAYKPSNYQLM
jgi:hypothetical protein